MGDESNNGLTSLLEQIPGSFRRGDWAEAREVLDRAHRINFEDPRVIAGLKACAFWQERDRRARDITDHYNRGEYWLSQWEKYQTQFSDNLGACFDRASFSLKQWVYHRALESFEEMAPCEADQNPDVLLRIGRCYKAIGDYGRAAEVVEKASQKRHNDSAILAELADLYALIGENRASKAFFREAFFINPGNIDIMSLEAPMIRRLIKEMEERGFNGEILKEWIPVYGVVYGIFNVKRELNSAEASKLQQKVLALTHELQENRDRFYLVPRVINHYFWLIDHLISKKEERSRIDDLLEKIRNLDPRIYELYIN